MKQVFLTLVTNVKFSGEIFRFLWQRKQWWLIPMVVLLVTIGLLFVFASSSGIGPFIYTLF